VLARDQGVPQQTGSVTVTVQVTRNTYSPVFTMHTYQVTIADSFIPSLPVITVRATDSDEQVRISTKVL
jgi:hypothetical protein